MKLCSIVPIKQKEWMENQPFVMLLAHLSEENRSYSRWASSLNTYKIMDNSIIEKGEAFSLDGLLKQADLCKVQEIILPDIFKDGLKTITLAKKCYGDIYYSPYKGKFKYMVVCHGKTENEVINSFHQIESLPWVTTIGIPKIIASWDNRNSFKKLYMKSKKQIHYLGCWDSFKEEIEIKNDPVFDKIRSMDTCLPSLLVKQHKVWDESRDHSYTIDLINDNIPRKEYKKMMEDLKVNLGL